MSIESAPRHGDGENPVRAPSGLAQPGLVRALAENLAQALARARAQESAGPTSDGQMLRRLEETIAARVAERENAWRSGLYRLRARQWETTDGDFL